MEREDYIIWTSPKGTENIWPHDQVERPNNTREIEVSFSNGSLNELMAPLNLQEFWLNKKGIIISANKKSEILTFFKRNSIVEKDFFYQLFSILNYELADWKDIRNDKVLNTELKYLEKDETTLELALEDFSKELNKGSIKSISFEFSHLTSVKKIDNEIVINYILSILKGRYKLSVGLDIERVYYLRRDLLIDQLFIFFSTPNNYKNFRSKSQTYTFLEDIFSLSDFVMKESAIIKAHQRFIEKSGQ